MKWNNNMTVYADRGEVVQSPQEETYALAEEMAFLDNIRAGLTLQSLRNTTLLAQAAIEPMQRFPEFREIFHSLVAEYAKTASDIIQWR